MSSFSRCWGWWWWWWWRWWLSWRCVRGDRLGRPGADHRLGDSVNMTRFHLLWTLIAIMMIIKKLLQSTAFLWWQCWGWDIFLCLNRYLPSAGHSDEQAEVTGSLLPPVIEACNLPPFVIEAAQAWGPGWRPQRHRPKNSQCTHFFCIQTFYIDQKQKFRGNKGYFYIFLTVSAGHTLGTKTRPNWAR